MDVLAALRETLALRLERSLEGEGTVHRVSEAAELEPRSDASVVAVFDARHPMTERAERVLERLGNDPGVALIAYADLSTSGTAAVARAGRLGLEGIILEGVDDDAATLRARLLQARRGALASGLLRELTTHTVALPPHLSVAVEQLFRRVKPPQDVEQLAREALMTRRALDRAFEIADLAAPSQYIRAARVLNAYVSLSIERRNPAEVARVQQFGRTTVLAQYVQSAVGTSLGEFAHLPPGMLVSRLATRLRRSASLSTSA